MDAVHTGVTATTSTQAITISRAFGVVGSAAAEAFASFKPTLDMLAPDISDKERETAIRYAAHLVAAADVSESSHAEVAKRALTECLQRSLRYVAPDNVLDFPSNRRSQAQQDRQEQAKEEEAAETSEDPKQAGGSGCDLLDALELGKTCDWTRPDGVIGPMADWFMTQMSKSNRPLAVAAALATITPVVGWRNLHSPTNCALNG